MATTTRARPRSRGRTRRQQPRGRSITVTLGPTPRQPRKPSGPRAPWVIARWGARWGGRGLKWGATQAWTRGRSHATRLFGDTRNWADMRGTLGWGMTVTDMSTGTVIRGDDLTTIRELLGETGPAPAGPAPAARPSPDPLSFRGWVHLWMSHWSTQLMGPPSLPAAGGGGGRPPPKPPEGTRPAPNQSGNQPSSQPDSQQPLIDLDELQPECWCWGSPAPPDGGETMANNVGSFEDLHSPDIDPFEFPEELPAHLGEASRLFGDQAAEWDAQAQAARAIAAAVHAYAEYMASAEVTMAVVSSIIAAADACEAQAQAMSQVAQAFSEAQTHIDTAQKQAEAEYGDWDVPRFDKAG